MFKPKTTISGRFGTVAERGPAPPVSVRYPYGVLTSDLWVMREYPESVPIAWTGSAFCLARSTPVFNRLARYDSWSIFRIVGYFWMMSSTILHIIKKTFSFLRANTASHSRPSTRRHSRTRTPRPGARQHFTIRRVVPHQRDLIPAQHGADAAQPVGQEVATLLNRYKGTFLLPSTIKTKV